MLYAQLSRHSHAYCVFCRVPNKKEKTAGAVFSAEGYCSTSVSTFMKKIASTMRMIGFTDFAPPFAKKRVPM